MTFFSVSTPPRSEVATAASHGISPEQRLFVGVILNAALEAAGAHRVGQETYTIQQSARAWFFNNGNDFRAVCNFAGLEPRDVRKHVLAYLAEVSENPAAQVRAKRHTERSNADQSRKCGVTIEDVAHHAGVSATTVSNVLHGRGHVTERTRTAVVAAITRLGYKRRAH